MAQPTTYVIAYDIRDPKRLRRVERHLSKLARRIQFSVFAADLTPAALEQQCTALERLIDARVDDLRIYPVPDGAEIETSGPPATDNGVMVIGDGTSRLTPGNRSPQDHPPTDGRRQQSPRSGPPDRPGNDGRET